MVDMIVAYDVARACMKLDDFCRVVQPKSWHTGNEDVN